MAVVIIITSAVTARFVRCGRWSGWALMQKVITLQVSGSATKGVWIAQGMAADTRTDLQKRSLRVLVRVLAADYPIREIVGHRDLSPDLDGDGVVEPEEWVKQCPCFDVASEREQKVFGEL